MVCTSDTGDNISVEGLIKTWFISKLITQVWGEKVGSVMGVEVLTGSRVCIFHSK